MSGLKKLLYCHTIRASSFGESIAIAVRSYDHIFTTEGENPFNSLFEADGIVFVGSQTRKLASSVFENKDDYYEFIDEAHDAGKRVAAVLNKQTFLPGYNKNIDFVVRADKGVKTIKDIAKELTQYFDTQIF